MIRVNTCLLHLLDHIVSSLILVQTLLSYHTETERQETCLACTSLIYIAALGKVSHTFLSFKSNKIYLRPKDVLKLFYSLALALHQLFQLWISFTNISKPLSDELSSSSKVSSKLVIQSISLVILTSRIMSIKMVKMERSLVKRMSCMLIIIAYVLY